MGTCDNSAGDAAAMREALEDARTYLLKHCGSSEAQAIARRINRALAAPPRNCDRYNSGDPVKDADDAYAEWQRQCDAAGVPPSCKVESAFRQWLFATAKPETKPMEANKHDNDFNAGFHNWMASAMAYDWYEKHGKPLPRIWKKRFDEGQA